MSAAELLLEIGTEEIPARFLPEAEANLKNMLVGKLNELGLTFNELNVYSTPRRLVAQAVDLLTRQPDREEEKLGPSVKAAFDKDGQPTKAALGFAKGQGVDVAELQTFTTDKGEYIGIKKLIAGRPAKDLLAALLPETILALPWPKPMRWGDGELRFVRPLHWVLALLGGETIAFRLDDVTSGNLTCGHRFHGQGMIEVRDFADYEAKLAKAKVMINVEARKELIREKLLAFAEQLGGHWIEDEELVEHVAYLCEWPVPLLGRFPEAYLALPREVLITPMREHQKYFGFEDGNGELLPAFCVIANLESNAPETVIAGNERVLIARLEDAKYFYEADRDKKLETLAGNLGGMLFHVKLGSYAEKVERVRKLANYIGAQVAGDELETIKRAALLYKADLLSGMVGEFPELQGVMGMYYARHQGETEEVAQAIFEHYLPRFAGDILPDSAAGAVLSIADKMDSIVACFGVGLQPTGAGDPYALRRQALGVLRILEQRRWNLPLTDLIRKALDGVEDKFKADREVLALEIFEFICDRLFHWVTAQGTPSGIANAVLAVRCDRVPTTLARLEAVAAFAAREEFAAFAAAFKRAGNIVKDYDDAGPVKAELLQEDAEKALQTAVLNVKDQVDKLVKAGDVLGALLTISEIRPQVDKFFDDVLVMHKDHEIRLNRLNLVSAVTALFEAIADFRQV